MISKQQRLDFEKMCNMIAERTTISPYEDSFVLSIVVENFSLEQSDKELCNRFVCG